VNTAVPQVYYNSLHGIRRLTTETGAGQWGTALAYASALFGVECEVWQVGASYDTKPQRRTLIEVFGGTVHRSPSRLTESGKAFAEDHPGSLGIAISEAVEVAAQADDTKYALGSVLNHVLLHQTVIGEEALLQLAKAGEGAPDVVIGCAGGGSNFAGLSFPFLRENLVNDAGTRIVAVEPASCPTITRGEYRYDFGDTAGMTPLMKMYTLGHDFVPSPIHAGGLRYHGMAPLVSHAVHEGFIDAVALEQTECFEVGVEFARTQGIVPAPESAHALAQARREALEAAETGEERVIVVGLSGHGLLELGAYESYLAGRLTDDAMSEEALAASLAGVPEV
jgi:tryptophan synthase beta chain